MSDEELVERMYSDLCFKPPEQWRDVLLAGLRVGVERERERLITPITNAVDEWVRDGDGTYTGLEAVITAVIRKGK